MFMNGSNWKFLTEDSAYHAGVKLRIFKRNPDDSLDVVVGLQVQHVEPNNMGPEEVPIPHREAEEFLRAALNCAWERGLRPDGFNDTRETMKATSAHLQDMRALAFHKIGADKP